MTSRAALVKALLARHGQTYGAELGLDLAHPGPGDLFGWLCAALLMSARIPAAAAIRAAAGLRRQGWTSAETLAASAWAERVAALDAAGYARYDEKTATQLGDLAETLRDAYGGDLRRLREATGCDPVEERRRILAFKGIGPVGADIFFREVQLAWDELFPFADARSLATAADLGLPATPAGLAALVPQSRFPALLAALTRARLAQEDARTLLRPAD